MHSTHRLALNKGFSAAQIPKILFWYSMYVGRTMEQEQWILNDECLEIHKHEGEFSVLRICCKL